MPIPIQLKRSTAAGVSPTTLADGEVAINVAASDPKLFFKDSASTIRAFSLASYASASHTHSASQISVQGLGGGGTAFIGPSASQFLYELDDDGITEAVLESGGLVVSAINDFATEAAKYGPVTSVNSLTGTIVLTSLGISAASAVHTHVAADITDFSSAVASASPEEVVEYLTTSVFPATGSTTLLYLATDASRAYRWTGSEYVEVGTSTLSASGSSSSGAGSRALTFLVR